ncbi:triosephosphate isomerase [Candidatus Gottesmanbacteria bacterium]|nr:triosephosphate isomerase [Candidatus Gottesmanbacteria bacterium]
MSGKQIYIIGNWKSNKNSQEVKDWFHAIKNIKSDHEIVVCPSFIHLPLAKILCTTLNLPLKIGAQDVSPYSIGAYTGEVAAEQLKEMVEYVIIGHSERRKNFKEDDNILFEKVKRATEAGLKPIFCVPDENTSVPEETHLIAYEPVWAIGTGKSDTPENANTVIGKIKQKYPGKIVIYGGSVTSKNISLFISMENIDGVLPGKASLDAMEFSQMISVVSQI